MRLQLAVLAAVGCACGGSNTATVHVTAPTDETIHFGSTVTKPLMGGEKVGDALTVETFGGTLAVSLQSSETSKTLGEKPRLRMAMSQRLVEPPQPSVPALTEAAFYGVGPFLTNLTFTSVDANNRPMNTGAGQVVFIDEWSFTGNGSNPFHIAGKTPKVNENDSSSVSLSLTFEAWSHCANKFVTGGTYHCGGVSLTGEPFTATVATEGLGGARCAPEIVKAFLGQGKGAEATYAPGSIRVAGASTSYACTSTKGESTSIACGASASVKVGNCTWRAYSAAGPDAARGVPAHISFWVGATTDASCVAQNWCNLEFEARQ